jgi:NhaA family Na+:H+ antiporter
MLVLAFFAMLVFIGFMKLGVQNIVIYAAISLIVWYGFHESGVHATIAGVIIGLLTPTKSWITENRFNQITKNMLHFLQGEGWSNSTDHYKKLREFEQATRTTVSPLKRLEKELHPWVGFVIMPVFALANTGVTIQASSITHSLALAVILGLVIGKPLGIFLFSWIAVKFNVAQLPKDISWMAVIGGGALAGIGFTMALFIAGLALSGNLLDVAKIGILIGSLLSAVLGFIILLVSLKNN